MKPCRCEICKLARRVERVWRKLSKPDQRVIEALWTAREAASVEAGYCEMKAKGTWPS